MTKKMTIKRPQLRKLKERASYPVSLVSLVADVLDLEVEDDEEDDY